MNKRSDSMLYSAGMEKLELKDGTIRYRFLYSKTKPNYKEIYNKLLKNEPVPGYEYLLEDDVIKKIITLKEIVS